MVPRFCRVLGWGGRIELRNVVGAQISGNPAEFRPRRLFALRRWEAQLGPSLLPGAKLRFSGLWSTVYGKANPARACGGAGSGCGRVQSLRSSLSAHHLADVDETLMRPSLPVRHFWPLRNQRFFCSRFRSRLLVETIGNAHAFDAQRLRRSLVPARIECEKPCALSTHRRRQGQASRLASHAACEIPKH
jgi:hypothetical protein